MCVFQDSIAIPVQEQWERVRLVRFKIRFPRFVSDFHITLSDY